MYDIIFTRYTLVIRHCYGLDCRLLLSNSNFNRERRLTFKRTLPPDSVSLLGTPAISSGSCDGEAFQKFIVDYMYTFMVEQRFGRLEHCHSRLSPPKSYSEFVYMVSPHMKRPNSSCGHKDIRTQNLCPGVVMTAESKILPEIGNHEARLRHSTNFFPYFLIS